MSFLNKVIAVTGGSSGIGLSVAQSFDRQGAKTAILGRNREKLLEAVNTLKHSLPVEGDVRKIADLDRFYLEIANRFGKVDVVVANAGIAEPRALEEVDEAFFDEMVDINFKGLYFSVQRALPFLNKHASIILISSAAAHISWPGHSVYSSTKAAVSYLARCFAAELIDRGIRVNALSPGFVKTPMFDGTPPEFMEKLKNNIPSKRFAHADEIAQAALYLASPQSSYIVGADLLIDGGLCSTYNIKDE